MNNGALNGLSAVEAAVGIRSRAFSSEELVRACLERIEEREPTVRAWEFIEPELALAQARRCDASEVRGPLHGLPVGVKDQFDTFDMPTTYGSGIYSRHRPAADAECVARLRAAGAVIVGKTKATEFSLYHPADTTNPHNPNHTPGGSSSGSAAAVADCMVPVATGTQTVGSIIRPASYCGVFGYKPTMGSISRAGVLPLCASLDTVGLFARSVEDLRLFARAMTSTDTHHPSIRTAQPLDLVPPDEMGSPRISFVRTPQWSELEESTRERLERAVAHLSGCGASVEEVALPAEFDGLVAAQDTILQVELARALSFEFQNHPDQLSKFLYDFIRTAHSISLDEYLSAKRLAAECHMVCGELFRSHEVLLAPSVRGEAPEGLESTGDPLFCRMWTLLGLPCVSLPGIHGPRGLPLGAQIIGPMYRDGLTLSVAGWAASQLGKAH